MNKKNPWANLALLTQLGISMFVPIAGCFFIGKYLDSRFGTGNLFLFIMTIMGVLAALRNMFVIGTRASRNNEKDSEEDNGNDSESKL
ncbi:AtpZ/AtpI family protein [Alkalibacter mobilis]|uniref:AtpZ/AtpI family protein n=1 Tax=Alkalibacter mobilis TaxID=2787712 RepID=UPI00189EABC2|nr:AtpZ/AtpI family protein [Alkalibacter mobilis]MBF7096161.1 AtpZ/AtpI family protein [Alkalibacter mobilis]